jgi:hypothetical protein
MMDVGAANAGVAAAAPASSASFRYGVFKQ